MTTQAQSPNDVELVRQARAGNVAAFESLVNRYYGLVYAIALSRLNHRDSAEDLAQEVFLRAHLLLDRLESPPRFSAWVGHIARNLAIDWARTGQSASRLLPMVPMENMPQDVPDRSAMNPRERLAVRERQNAVQKALAKLPPEQRELVLLHYMENLTHREIADRLGLHHATVSRRLQLALRLLRGMLGPILSEGTQRLVSSPCAKTRTTTMIAIAAALSPAAKASIAAAATTGVGKSIVMAASAEVAKIGASTVSTAFGPLQPLVKFFTSGGKIMIFGKGLLATVILGLICGGTVIIFRDGQAQTGASSTRPLEAIVPGQTLPGIDVLVERNFDAIAGKRVGLITNHTGLSRSGESDIDILHASTQCNLVALFSPEHGIRGDSDQNVAGGVDAKTRLPIYSLYGKTQIPTAEMLKELDVLVFDIQDVGTRFYTYIGTMALAMKAAKQYKKKFVVLDRPNPIGGLKVEGSIPSEKLCGDLTCIYPMPTRHGMTIGELARFFNKYYEIGCDLEVVPMKNWSRAHYYDETGLRWENPSPNMKTLDGAILYPGPGSLETTNLSVARGTQLPFEMYGAPYFDPERILENLNRRSIPGLRFEPCEFTPTAQFHKFKDQPCKGFRVIITDREKLDSVTAGLHLAQAIYETHPDQFIADGGYRTETGDEKTWSMLTKQKMTPEQIVEAWRPALDKFLRLRENVLLY